MEVYLVSFYYRSDISSGANKRFDETGKFLKKNKIPLKVVVHKGEKPVWCEENETVELDNNSINSSVFRRINLFLRFNYFLLKIPKSIIISDFMPIPSLVLKQHKHLQLIHDLRNFTEFNRAKLRYLSSKWQCRQWNKAQSIITVSEFTKRELSRHCKIPKSKIIVSYNGITDQYLENNDFKGARDIDFLFVSWFEKRKNHLQLLMAMNELKKEGVIFSAELIGRDNGTLPDVESYIKKNNLSEYVKVNYDRISEDELIYKYSRTKVYVSPSLYEGFGMPLIEAMSRGCHVACSEIDVFEEVCKEHAYYFDPNNVDDIKDRMVQALNSANSRKTNYEYVLNKFSWDSALNPLKNYIVESTLTAD